MTKLVTTSENPNSLWMFGSAVVVKAPACRPCRRSLHLHRWASIAVISVVATLALFWVWPLVEGSVPRAVRKWAMMGVALGCVLPYIVFQAFFPPPFDVTAYSESIDYEFRDAELAREFAALVREVDLSLIEWRLKQIVAHQLHAATCRRADAQPIQSKRVATGNPVL